MLCLRRPMLLLSGNIKPTWWTPKLIKLQRKEQAWKERWTPPALMIWNLINNNYYVNCFDLPSAIPRQQGRPFLDCQRGSSQGSRADGQLQVAAAGYRACGVGISGRARNGRRQRVYSSQYNSPAICESKYPGLNAPKFGFRSALPSTLPVQPVFNSNSSSAL